MDFQLPTDLTTYTQWAGILTIFFLVLTIVAFLLKWGLRFRLVGATAFMGVITIGIFGLSLGLFNRTDIPGSIRYSLVFDNAAENVVIAVPTEITETELDATLRQAAIDITPYGRQNTPDGKVTVRARTVLHPEEGVSRPLYIGKVTKSIQSRDETKLEVKIFEDKFQQLGNG
ncbi:MAG: DUF2518 family protein [Kamptonema sp. SIO4C4]|nr:DUF2518 family protein [Kamptonema sp. SIO4C4]